VETNVLVKMFTRLKDWVACVVYWCNTYWKIYVIWRV